MADELAFGAALRRVSERLDGLIEREHAIDHRLELELAHKRSWIESAQPEH